MHERQDIPHRHMYSQRQYSILWLSWHKQRHCPLSAFHKANQLYTNLSLQPLKYHRHQLLGYKDLNVSELIYCQNQVQYVV